jgi:hypothetical protein
MEHSTVKAVFAFVLTWLVGAEIELYSGLPVLLPIGRSGNVRLPSTIYRS